MIKERYSERALELIKGSYDLHVHTAPSHFKRLMDDFELALEADKYNMSGILIKNHYEPTGARAIIANKYSGSKAKLYGSIALNWPVGGINPYAVESSLRMGCKIVWLPTRDAANSLLYGDMPGDFFIRPEISIFDDNGNVKRSLYETLEVVKKYDAFIATGHLSLKETFAVINAVCEMKVKCILTHPDWSRTKIDLVDQVDISKKGVIIEKVWSTIADGDISTEEVSLSIRTIGSQNIIMTTDRGQQDKESPVLGMLSFIECMLNNGITANEIRDMVRQIPRNVIKV